MPNKKNILQKSSFIAAVISFMLAIACALGMYFKTQSLGIDDPIAVSLLASTFFFACVGGVLLVIASADIPSFKV